MLCRASKVDFALIGIDVQARELREFVEEEFDSSCIPLVSPQEDHEVIHKD